MGKIEFDTFRELGFYYQNSITQENPSVFNREVNIVKTRVTFEVVDEPIEVLQERLQGLWDKEGNHHSRQPLRDYAKILNYEFVGQMGNKRG